MIAWLLTVLASAAEPTLPVVDAAVPPVYPAAALASGDEAVVVLEVEVSAAGDVVTAAVVQSAGGPYAAQFDQAALEALRAYRFTPARDAEGAPTAARIQYAMRFVPTQAAALSVEGVVVAASTQTPLAGVEVRAVGPNGGERLGVTDAEGRWRFAGMPDGAWAVTLQAPGYETSTAELVVQTGKVATVTVYAEKSEEGKPADAALEIVVVGTRPSAEVTERVLQASEIRYLPGTNGDVVKVIQNLPGVSRPALGIGQLLIRGTAPEDSAYYIDGTEIPVVFHFAGFSTLVNGDFLQEVSFLPGNYSARFGRQLGGVVELRTRQALPDKSIRYASVDLFQTTVFIDQLVSDRTSLSASFRRSYVDAILNPILKAAGAGDVRAPRYYDGQVRVLHELPSGGTVSAMVFGSDDTFRILGEEEGAVDFGLGISLLKGKVEFQQPLTNGWIADTALLVGPERQTFAIGDAGEAYEKPWNCNLRHEWQRAPRDGVGWRVGADLLGGTFAYKYDIEGFPGEPEGGDVSYFAPGFYLEPTLEVGKFSMTPGLRADAWWVYDAEVALGALDPRMSARYTASSQVTLKAGFGKYTQFPQFRQIDAQTGNPDLGPSDALQTSAGLELELSRIVSLEVTGFSNALRQLVVGREDAFAFFSGPPPSGPLDSGDYANEGSGQSSGLELLARLEADRTVGWLAGTFQRSTRTDRNGDTSLFAYDQPIVLTALVSHQLPKSWRLGARLRYGSGNPYTPVVNRYWDLGSRTWIPVYAEPDSARLPPFWQADVRFDKDWKFRKWMLTFYLDVQNATSRANVEVAQWTEDFAEEANVTSLPILPVFGLRGEW